MENEIMNNYEEIEVIEGDIVTDEKTGMGTGVAMLIGAGLTLAVGAGVKLVKKGIAAIKAKKAAQADGSVGDDSQDADDTVTDK